MIGSRIGLLLYLIIDSKLLPEPCADLSKRINPTITATSRERLDVSNEPKLDCLFNNLSRLIAKQGGMCNTGYPPETRKSILNPNLLQYRLRITNFPITQSKMTSSNWNIFRVTGPLWEEFTGEFPSQRPLTRSFNFFFDLQTNFCVNNRDAGDLRRHRAHHDVTAMFCTFHRARQALCKIATWLDNSNGVMNERGSARFEFKVSFG